MDTESHIPLGSNIKGTYQELSSSHDVDGKMFEGEKLTPDKYNQPTEEEIYPTEVVFHDNRNVYAPELKIEDRDVSIEDVEKHINKTIQEYKKAILEEDFKIEQHLQPLSRAKEMAIYSGLEGESLETLQEVLESVSKSYLTRVGEVKSKTLGSSSHKLWGIEYLIKNPVDLRIIEEEDLTEILSLTSGIIHDEIIERINNSFQSSRFKRDDVRTIINREQVRRLQLWSNSSKEDTLKEVSSIIREEIIEKALSELGRMNYNVDDAKKVIIQEAPKEEDTNPSTIYLLSEEDSSEIRERVSAGLTQIFLDNINTGSGHQDILQIRDFVTWAKEGIIIDQSYVDRLKNDMRRNINTWINDPKIKTYDISKFIQSLVQTGLFSDITISVLRKNLSTRNSVRNTAEVAV
jgi:hypothetical protein